MWYWQIKKKLLKKYNGICFLDAEESNYIGRIVGIEWRPKAKSCTAHFHLVASDVNDKANTSSALSYAPYLINEILHDMILVCPRELNDAFKLISDTNN
jgi:hypothetical protein